MRGSEQLVADVVDGGGEATKAELGRLGNLRRLARRLVAVGQRPNHPLLFGEEDGAVRGRES